MVAYHITDMSRLYGIVILSRYRPFNSLTSQAHVCISNTSRAGAELGYDVSVLSDGIGDRDIPGASAKQLVDVSMMTRAKCEKC